MYLWESDIRESIVFKPVEIRGKKGRKKRKNSNTAIYIPNMDADNFEEICIENGLKFIYVEVPPHGRLIDADALTKQIKRDGIASDPFVRIVCDYFKDAPTVLPAEEGE